MSYFKTRFPLYFMSFLIALNSFCPIVLGAKGDLFKYLGDKSHPITDAQLDELIKFEKLDQRELSDDGYLHLAIRNHPLHTVRALFDHLPGAAVMGVFDKCDSTGETPLHIAVAADDVNVVDFLLANGARINVLNSRKKPPLFCAIENKQEQMVRYLVEQCDADLHQVWDGGTVLHAAIRVAAEKGSEAIGNRMLQFLAAKVTDVRILDACDASGETPLHLAVDKHNDFATKLLLDYGANSYCPKCNGHHFSYSYYPALEDGECFQLALEESVDGPVYLKAYKGNLYVDTKANGSWLTTRKLSNNRYIFAVGKCKALLESKSNVLDVDHMSPIAKLAAGSIIFAGGTVIAMAMLSSNCKLVDGIICAANSFGSLGYSPLNNPPMLSQLWHFEQEGKTEYFRIYNRKLSELALCLTYSGKDKKLCMAPYIDRDNPDHCRQLWKIIREDSH